MTDTTCEYQTQAFNFLNNNNIKLTMTPDREVTGWDGVNTAMRYNCTMTNRSTKAVARFQFTNSVHAYQNNEPLTEYGFLAAMWVDYSRGYSEFCSDMGYEPFDKDTGKLNAESRRVFKAVQSQNNKLNRLFNEAQLEELHEIN